MTRNEEEIFTPQSLQLFQMFGTGQSQAFEEKFKTKFDWTWLEPTSNSYWMTGNEHFRPGRCKWAWLLPNMAE